MRVAALEDSGKMQTALHIPFKWICARIWSQRSPVRIRVCKTCRACLLSRKEPQVVGRIDFWRRRDLCTCRTIPLVMPCNTASTALACLTIRDRDICIHCHTAHRTMHVAHRVGCQVLLALKVDNLQGFNRTKYDERCRNNTSTHS